MRVAAVTIVLGAVASVPLWSNAQSAHHTVSARIDRVVVPAGPFTMGADAGGEPDERPRHTASTTAFRVDRREVSRGDFMRCVDAGRCTPPRDMGPRFRDTEQPVVGVSWTQARAYCAWANGRLPTEQEWEKAARGTDGRTYPWGEAPPTAARAVFGRGPGGAPERVGERPAGASPWGALDMAGNVWEWTESPYDPLAYRSPQVSPTCDTALRALATLRRLGARGFTGSNPLPTTCERTLRGGAWNYSARGLRVTNRVHHPPAWQIVVAGFRCVDDATPPTPPPTHLPNRVESSDTIANRHPSMTPAATTAP